jgi:4-carboxymuconolactone decarboxylase
MSTLTSRDRELVVLGAAIASNCIPCIERHVPEARKAGLTDEEIAEAVSLAEKVKRVPATKVLDVAAALLNAPLPGCTAAAPEPATENVATTMNRCMQNMAGMRGPTAAGGGSCC